MVDLAKQAFSTTNYDLAAEIYEREIVESGPSVVLYLGLADSYVRCGYLGKAFDAYTKAFRVGQVAHDKLGHLVNALTSAMSGIGPDETGETSTSQSSGDPFSCGSCKSFLNEPVSIICGHTFCKGCLEKQDKKLCKVCDAQIQKGSLKVNVLLLNISERWFSSELRAVKLKMEGNKYFQDNSLCEAIALYSEALTLAPHDHLIASNRCYAYLSQHKYREALQDAELCITLKSDWAKGYFRKAVALSGLNQHEEAAMALLQCLSLDSDITTAKVCLTQSLHKLLSPSENEMLKHSQFAASHHPTNPLLHALRLGGNYSENRLTKGDVDYTMEMLKSSVSQSLHENSEKSSKWWLEECREQSSNRYENSQGESSHGSIKKCNSSPCLNTPSHSQHTQESYSHLLSVQRYSTDCSPHTTGSAQSDRLMSNSADRLNTDHRAHKGIEQKAHSLQRRKERHVKEELLNKEDFDCALCFRLLYHPVTTPCGHVFCRECLDRCLDHSPVCPLCKSSLLEYLAERRSRVTEAIEQILQMYFASAFEERQKLNEEEMSQISRLCSGEKAEIPVFVCTLAYPQVPCPLHVFEPKYRLMMRQCMESGLRQFGMVMGLGDDEINFADYGTMLEIRDLQYFPDGRSVVDTIGGRRFKVLERGHRDGYCTAKVEFIRDEASFGDELQEVSNLHDQVLKDAQSWFTSLMDVPRQRILSHFGDFPAVAENHLHLPNGPKWHWWLVAVMPLDNRVQLAILSMSSLKQRLLAIKRVLTFLRSKRSM